MERVLETILESYRLIKDREDAMGHFDLSLFPSTFRFLLTVTSSLFQQIPNPRFNFNFKS